MAASSKREIHRTRTGCWTCRARRKKCDEGRPSCNLCSSLNIPCEGYGVRLRWSPHRRPCIASRPARRNVRFSPSRNTRVQPSQHLRDCKPRLQIPQDIDSRLLNRLSEHEKTVFYDFISWGAETLASGVDNEDIQWFIDGSIASNSLLITCLTYQLTIDPQQSKYVEQYYVRSLEEFRKELTAPASMNEEYTPWAGMMLSTISMNLALPWTIHLNGMASILEERGISSMSGEIEKDLLNLIGVLDLPTHILGRKTRNLDAWYRHCRGQSGIEDITGLPCSLVDLLSSWMEPDVESRLRQWKYESGDAAERQMWDATRYAAIISIRDLERRSLGDQLKIQDTSKTEVAATGLFWLSIRSAHSTLLEILREVEKKSSDEPSSLRPAFLYPLVIAGSHPELLRLEDRHLILENLNRVITNGIDISPFYSAIKRVLAELWNNTEYCSLDGIARACDLELGLIL